MYQCTKGEPTKPTQPILLEPKTDLDAVTSNRKNHNGRPATQGPEALMPGPLCMTQIMNGNNIGLHATYFANACPI